jgi:hypothetical protein
MQPYFFPYIGYWQLIHSVDKFVIYDDVNYIKGGWINRNRILINGEPVYITAPLHQASSYKRICDIALQPSPLWREKLVKMVENTYRKASSFPDVFPVIETLIRYPAGNLSDYLSNQLLTLSKLIGINSDFVITSRCYGNAELSGQTRIIDICNREGATAYINLKGGQTLYDTGTFRSEGIDLLFVNMQTISYKQKINCFVPNLSIIDALMALGPEEIKGHLDSFNLFAGDHHEN